MGFVKFIQKEQSTLPQYLDLGVYSSSYTKQVKKPFKKEKSEQYVVNDMLASGIDMAFDPLTVYEHLRELVCSGLRGDITLMVQEKEKRLLYYFEYKGEAAVSTSNGNMLAYHFTRKRKTSTRETSIWFAHQQHFLPMKIEQEKDGDTQALLIATSISVNK